MSTGPITAYHARHEAGELTLDPAQLRAAEKLQALHDALDAPAGGGLLARLGLGRRGDEPLGVYIHGPVGRGKSMLMDLFFDGAPETRKRRVHFHSFMAEAHDRLHRIRTEAKGKPRDADLIAPLAAGIADETRLLCFDEFQVTNIADAMILGRLFEALFDKGVVVVATSNVAPRDLYKGGLQRDRFEPFIELIEARLDVVHLDGGADHRLGTVNGVEAWITPTGPKATRKLERVFRRLTGGRKGEACAVAHKGREIRVPRAAAGVAWFDFADLCEAPLAAGDYLALADQFDAMVLDGIPALDADRRNEARRFIHLIDALYERKVKLFAAAAAPPERLHPEGTHADEFLRTASRLAEMQGDDWLRDG